MTCHTCSAETDRTCARCRRPVCSACAASWPGYHLALVQGIATCRACTLAEVRYLLEQTRAWLLAEGVEPGF